MSLSFMLTNLLIISYSALFFKENEKNFVEIFNMNKENEKEKHKWFGILDSLPFIVMIYDRIKNTF